jgi:hypothetical protein
VPQEYAFAALERLITYSEEEEAEGRPRSFEGVREVSNHATKQA